jgi:hypothetical protein
MIKNKNVPDILLLDAINPKERDGRLVSPNLSGRISEYAPKESAMWQAFMETDEDSLDELYFAHKLASFYLLQTALQEQVSPNKKLWIERFNKAVEEVYSLPESREVIYLMSQELPLLNKFNPDSLPSQVYRQAVIEAGPDVREGFDMEKLEPFKQAVFEKLHVITEVIDNLEDREYEAAEVREIFQRIVDKMAMEEEGWKEWEITNTPGKKMLSVRSSIKEIDVPDGRGPIGSKKELLGLAMHEIGIHALRSVNGYKTGDELMGKGLPEGHFEEGLAIILEFFCTGEIPQKIKDRYIDVALAAGVAGKSPLSRQQLIELGIERQRIRDKAAGRTPDDHAISKKIRVHVDRIFRGGDGQPLIDEEGNISEQAVFIKDADYYTSFINAYRYLIEKAESNYPVHHLLDYLFAGKFDPSNERHTKYLKEEHSLAL